MKITFKKGRDKPSTLICERADGSTTWTPLKPGFGVFHDLAHYVVETTLGTRDGFFGIVERGFDITSFERKEDRADVGPENIYFEHVSATLQQVALSGMAIDEFNDLLIAAVSDLPERFRSPIPADTLLEMQSRYLEYVMHWQALAPGERMELEFG